MLRRFGLDLCLGRIVGTASAELVYIGRLGLTDMAGRRLLLDWRAPFFGATHACPMGLASRRRYRRTGGRSSDYWDEVFTPEGLDGYAALADQSAFIASLGASRSARMRDVLGTIKADQDVVTRAGSRGALFIGPQQPYLAYVADVLPSLSEDGVQTATLRDLVAEGDAAGVEPDPAVARLKASADLAR